MSDLDAETTSFEVTTDDGAILQIRQVGPAAGPTVVALHGWTSCKEVWDDVTPLLVDAGYRVVSYDCRGHGRSSTGDSEPTIDRLADDLAVLLDHLDLEQVVLLGHSMGGATILRAALERDPRIAGLVVVSSSAAFIRPSWLQPVARAFGWLQGTRVSVLMMKSRMGYWLIRPVLGAKPPSGTVEATLDSYRRTPPAIVSGQFRLLTRVDLLDQLDRIAVPAAVLAGGRDILTPPAHSRAMGEVIADATVEVFAGAGHMLPLERPAEVADRVVSLARRAGVGPAVGPTDRPAQART